jgi:HK97 family phage major capsid protein
MQFYWAGEGEEKTETEAQFRKVNLVAKKLIGYTNASDELLEDSAISLADFLTGPLGFAGGVSWMEDYAFLRGVGGGQPRGIVGAPATINVTRNTAGTISYVDCINMLESLLPSANARWYISQAAMSDLIQMSGPTGNASYVWQPNAREGTPARLFGLPVHWTEKTAAPGATGDIVLADPQYYIIGDRQQTTIDSSTAPRWVYDETSWRVVHRVDGQPWLSSPLTYQDQATQVSPFVVLSGTSS